MATLANRNALLLAALAISGLLGGQQVRAAASPPLAQGWTTVAMPARQASNPRLQVSYSPGNGAPTWLLPTQRGLIALGGGEGCCPPQLFPTEWISKDSRTWRQIPLPPSEFGPGRISAASAGRAGLVAVGARFLSGPPKPGPLPIATWFSPNGQTWRKGTPIGNAFADGELLAVTANGAGFVAVGDIQWLGDEFSPPSIRMAVWLSPDGSHWQLVSDSSPVFQNATASVILHGAEGLVAIGTSGAIFDSGPSSTTLVWTSRDGRVWRRVPQMPGVFPTGGDIRIQGAVGGNGHYVAWGANFDDVPQYLVWTSTDGAHWKRAPGIHFQYGLVKAIAPHGRGFVAIGARDYEPTLWSSLDGTHWAPVVGEDVFGGGDTQLTDAVDWQGRLVIIGSYNRPPPPNPTAGSELVYRPTAWVSVPGVRTQNYSQWATTDPKWFRLRISDLPAGFYVDNRGPIGYFLGCELTPDLSVRHLGALQRMKSDTQTDVAGPCRKALAALNPSPSPPFYFRFPYGDSAITNSENAPYVGGFAIRTRQPSQAQAAFRYAGGLVHAVDLNLNRVAAKPIRSVAIGQGAELFSQSITSTCPGTPAQCPPFLQGGTAYAVVWRDGPALGVVEVVGVPGDRETLAIRLAQRQWARRHVLGF